MKSFLQGKKSLSVEPLRAPLPLAAQPQPKCSPAHGGGASAGAGAAPTSAHVEVVKEGDKVVRLIVTCACGERVEVECLYSPGR